MKKIRCENLNEIILVLGGARALADLLDCSPSAISNWKATTGRVPSCHYALIALELDKRGYQAPWHLFTFTGIGDEAA